MSSQDPYFESNLKAMKGIWTRVQTKTVRQGVEYIVYIEDDIRFLYYSGLVDTEKFTLKQWQKAFADCREEQEGENKYWVTYEKFTSLAKYRYGKVVGAPFDPFKLRCGKYTLEQFWKLYEASIMPACILPKEFFEELFDKLYRKRMPLEQIIGVEIKALKEQGRQVNSEPIKFEGDLVVLDKTHIRNLIADLITEFPSPKQRLALQVQSVKAKQVQGLADSTQNQQKSGFTTGDVRKVTKASLHDVLLKTTHVGDRLKQTEKKESNGEVFSIGALKKNRGPVKF